MNSEDKLFVVTFTQGLNIRSSGKNLGPQNDIGDFDLAYGDVIHAVAVEEKDGSVYHKFDRIYRDGTPYDLPFDKFPSFQASPTGEYWTAEKSGSTIYMKETDIATAVKTPTDKPASNFKYVGWRVLHKDEGGHPRTPNGMPEVIPPVVQRALDMTKEIQEMSFNLMKHFNKDITPKLWTNVHDGERAFTNFNGFGNGKQGGGPRANFITSSDLSAPLPRYDKMGRLCGGMFVRGVQQGNELVCTPGKHGIDANKPLPDIQTIVDNNWYFFAIVWYQAKGKKPGYVSHFPAGKGSDGPVAIPFIFNMDVKFPIEYFEKWEADELPDSVKYYRK